MTKPNVLILIDSHRVGGPGKGLFQFINNSPTESFNFQLCNFKYKDPISREFIKRAAEEQLELILFTQNYLFDPSPIFQLYKKIKIGHFNIIQTHSTKAHLIAWLVTRVLSIPWITVAHGYTNENWKIRMYNRLDKWLLKQADHAVAVSPVLYNMLLELRKETKSNELILNAVDETEIPRLLGGKEIRKRCRVNDRDILIGAFGRLSPEKGQEVLLLAFSKLNNDQPISLILLGDGQDLVKLKALANDLGITDKVFFHGHQKHMRDYYEAIDLLVLPSLSEGLPNVVLEAMALGKPVLSTDVGAISEVIIDNETGWIVPPGNAEALSKKLNEILLKPKKLKDTGNKARDSLFPKFSAKERANKFIGLYRHLLSDKS